MGLRGGREMTESEIWKDVVGYEGYYKVSNKGNVFSVERKNSRGAKCGRRTLKPVYDKEGYPRRDLYKNGKSKTKRIHRLVAEAFIPNPESLPQINHRDEVKDNNNVENLEWCTNKYNSNHGTRNERLAQSRSKRVKAVNVETGEVLTFSSIMEAGCKGYHGGNVSSACRGVYKSGNTGKLIGDGRTYKGHRWYYEEVK